MTAGFDLGKGTVIRFQGKDRCRIFNNLCTQDLRQLSNGQALETFVTDAKGRTFGHGIAAAWGDEAWFITVPNQAAKLVAHFDRYIIREDVIVSDESDRFRFLLFRDRASAAAALNLSVDQIPIGRQTTSAVAVESQTEVQMLAAPWIGIESILCLVPSAQGMDWTRQRRDLPCLTSDMMHRVDWERDRIHAFWPWYGVDMDDRNLPQELDRNETAISFNKGCYLGQETIARLDMLGQVQKKLVRLDIESSPPTVPCSVIAGDKEVGTVCSAATEPTSGNSVALAYVKRSHFKAGQVLQVGGCKASVE